MNVEAVLAVADAIELRSVPDLKFNMAHFIKRGGCGTAACVAGWTVIILGGGELDWDLEHTYQEMATSILDLNTVDAWDLFYGTGRSVPKIEDISREQAVRTLRHLAETGEVNWRIGNGS